MSTIDEIVKLVGELEAQIGAKSGGSAWGATTLHVGDLAWEDASPRSEFEARSYAEKRGLPVERRSLFTQFPRKVIT